MALTLRLSFIIGYWTGSRVILNIDYVQLVAKLCVGVVQDWITLELAIRIHNARGHSDISEAAKNKLSRIFTFLFAALTLVTCVFSLAIILTARKQENGGLAFEKNMCLLNNIFGFSFLI